MADLMDKIDTLKLKEILEEKEMKFTIADINALMDSELEKSPEEMNTDLVDLCVAALDKGIPVQETTAETTPTKRKVKVGKILLIAAVAALLCAVAIPVGARFMPSEAADAIIDFCYDHFKIDLHGESKPAEASEDNNLLNNLILESLHTLKLPEVLLGDEYEKSARMQEDELMTTVYVEFSNANAQISGTIVVSSYKNGKVELHNGIGNVSDVYKVFKQFNIDDMDILVFADFEKSYIKYIDNNNEYEILLYSDFDTAVKIAESIK